MDRLYIPLQVIVDQYAPAYGNSWEEYFTDEEHINTPTVEGLREELRTRGGFEHPVILSPQDENDEEDDRPTIYDGMHRLLAHFLEGGLDASVHVREGYSQEKLPEIVIAFVLRVDSELFMETWETIIDRLSWRCSDGEHSEWMSFDGMTSRGNIVNISLWAWGDNKVNIEKIATDVQDRLKGIVEVLGYRRWNLDEEMEEYLDWKWEQ